MSYDVPLADAEKAYPEYSFLAALTPSEQKAAFHVRDADGNDLCLKLISPAHDIDRVNREIESLQEISHPNVVSIAEYTYSIRPGRRRHHILEEFIEGTDLTDVLAGGVLPTAEALRVFEGILKGLDVLREKDIVHRDLKPANIRVRSTGEPVIIDFGLARRLRAPDLTDTAQGAAIGTPTHFAPEQFRGEKRDIDHRTDLFAVGVLMYTATVGEHPFFRPGMSYADLDKAICESDSHLAQSDFLQLPAALRVTIQRMLAKERVGRPTSASLVLKMLEKLRGVSRA